MARITRKTKRYPSPLTDEEWGGLRRRCRHPASCTGGGRRPVGRPPGTDNLPKDLEQQTGCVPASPKERPSPRRCLEKELSGVSP